MQPTGFLEQKANNNNAPSSSSYKRNYIFNFFLFLALTFLGKIQVIPTGRK
jgi:hypothetical protein